MGSELEGDFAHSEQENDKEATKSGHEPKKDQEQDTAQDKAKKEGTKDKKDNKERDSEQGYERKQWAGKGWSAAQGSQGSGWKDGDWTCGSCGDHQFARNLMCRKCKSPKAEAVQHETPTERETGGWGKGMQGGSSQYGWHPAHPQEAHFLNMGSGCYPQMQGFYPYPLGMYGPPPLAAGKGYGTGPRDDEGEQGYVQEKRDRSRSANTGVRLKERPRSPIMKKDDVVKKMEELQGEFERRVEEEVGRRMAVETKKMKATYEGMRAGMEASLRKKFDAAIKAGLDEEEQRLRNREIRGRKDVVDYVKVMVEGYKGDILQHIKGYYEEWERQELPTILDKLDLKESEWKRGAPAPAPKLPKVSELWANAGPSGKTGLVKAGGSDDKLVSSSSGSDYSEEEEGTKESGSGAVLQPKSKVMAKAPLVEAKKQTKESKTKKDKRKAKGTK